MKEKNNLPKVLLAALLILAGILSPSNGVDDGSGKSPLELLAIVAIILFCGLAVYLIWNRVYPHQKSRTTEYESTNENKSTYN